MSIAFSVSELINIAIGIERRGIIFYDVMAKSTDSDMAKAAFQNLAKMEREHIQIFQNMLDEGEKYQPLEKLTEEHAGYLWALVDSAVFTDDMITSEIATQVDSDIKAVELGISAEKDTILFYSQMRDAMPRPAIPTLDRVIAEEKQHLQQLTEIKRSLTAPR